MPTPVTTITPSHTYRYICEDTLTGVKLASIPMYGVNFKAYLTTLGQTGRYGEFTGTFRADLPGFSVQELLGATIPGRTTLYVERDGVLIWSGIVQSRTYQSQSLDYQLYAQSHDAIMDGQFLTTDTSGTQDPRNTILSMWSTMESNPASNYRVGYAARYTPEVNPQQTVAWKGTDWNPMSDEVKAAVEAGAEYRFNYRYISPIQRETDVEIGRWDLAAYRLGAPLGPNSTTLRYPGEITQYWTTDGVQQAATIVYAIGAATGSTTIRQTYTNTAFLNQGWPQFGRKFNWNTVTDQTTLNNALANAMQQFQPPYVSPTFKQNAGQGFGSYALGDYIRIVIDDPYRYPDGPNVQNIRVVGWQLSPETSTTLEQCDFTVSQPQ